MISLSEAVNGILLNRLALKAKRTNYFLNLAFCGTKANSSPKRILIDRLFRHRIIPGLGPFNGIVVFFPLPHANRMTEFCTVRDRLGRLRWWRNPTRDVPRRVSSDCFGDHWHKEVICCFFSYSVYPEGSSTGIPRDDPRPDDRLLVTKRHCVVESSNINYI